MEILNRQICLKYFLIVLGILFSSILFGQTKTDKELYAIWKDSSKPETVRLEAIWERMDVDSLPNQEPDWWKKWQNEPKEAIELAVKNNKKGYLPLFYMMSTQACSDNTECICTYAKKAIESAKIANASKLPVVFGAYFTLAFQCNENVKDEDLINEFMISIKSLTFFASANSIRINFLIPLKFLLRIFPNSALEIRYFSVVVSPVSEVVASPRPGG